MSWQGWDSANFIGTLSHPSKLSSKFRLLRTLLRLTTTEPLKKKADLHENSKTFFLHLSQKQ